jgi:spore maturation protein CgeB
MLQATDVTRFQPVPADSTRAHDVVVVAKSRDVFRSAVADAIAVGLRPAIYGSGWETFVDPELVVRSYVPNEELPVVYSSAGVLLNDHWQSMHEWGFVSNRLFDALACETPVISDAMPEIDELFDGTVLTYREPTELRALVDALLDDPTAARARAARGRRIVVDHHTFEHRAQQFLQLLQRYNLDPSHR